MTETDYPPLWNDIWELRKPPCPNGSKPSHEELCEAARLTFRDFLLRIYREEVRKKYPGLPLGDIDPLVIRVVQLHHWTIDIATALNEEGLLIALADELKHFKLPEPAIRWAWGRLQHLPDSEGYELLEPHRPAGMEKLPQPTS